MTTLCGAFDATQPPCHNWEGLHCCGKPPGHDGEHLCAGKDGRTWPSEPKLVFMGIDLAHPAKLPPTLKKRR